MLEATAPVQQKPENIIDVSLLLQSNLDAQNEMELDQEDVPHFLKFQAF